MNDKLREAVLRGPTRNGKPLHFPNLDHDPTLPDVLDAIAAWMDRIDDRDPNPYASREVQRDLRKWAAALRAALATQPSEPGLDVERLARAIHSLKAMPSPEVDAMCSETAERIARQYARLASEVGE